MAGIPFTMLPMHYLVLCIDLLTSLGWVHILPLTIAIIIFIPPFLFTFSYPLTTLLGANANIGLGRFHVLHTLIFYLVSSFIQLSY